MSTIQPPRGPTHGPAPVDTPRPAGETAGTAPTPGFQEALAARPSPGGAGAVQGAVQGAGTARTDTVASVLAELRAGSITPDDAVRRMTQAVVNGTGVPAPLRAGLEAHMKKLLAQDPAVGAMLRRMGASIPQDE